jgi:hypothetical protein
MEKFWKYFKLIVLVWGFVCLGIVLLIVATILLQNVSNKHEEKQAEQVDTSFKKTVGEVKLKVATAPDDPGRSFVTISKNEKTLVASYELPAKQFDLGWFEVNDARVYPMGGGSYRIILSSDESESDHDYSHKYIWQFTLGKEMNFDRMIDLSNAQMIPGDESLLIGHRAITLPSFGDEAYRELDAPVVVKVGNPLCMSTMLSQRNVGLMKKYYDAMIRQRIDMLTKNEDAELKKTYQRRLKEFEEATSSDTACG